MIKRYRTVRFVSLMFQTDVAEDCVVTSASINLVTEFYGRPARINVLFYERLDVLFFERLDILFYERPDVLFYERLDTLLYERLREFLKC